MKKFFVIVFLIFIMFFSACSNKEETQFELECVEKANSLVPNELTLKFYENNVDDVDTWELDYFLEEIIWSDKMRSIADRGFHKLRSGTGDPNLYYSFESNSKTDEAWPHTMQIKYEKEIRENGEIISKDKIVYDFVLKATDNITYEQKYNDLLREFEENKIKGEREFKIEEFEIIDCELSE